MLFSSLIVALPSARECLLVEVCEVHAGRVVEQGVGHRREQEVSVKRELTVKDTIQ